MRSQPAQYVLNIHDDRSDPDTLTVPKGAWIEIVSVLVLLGARPAGSRACVPRETPTKDLIQRS